jgi:hypothetical protein
MCTRKRADTCFSEPQRSAPSYRVLGRPDIDLSIQPSLREPYSRAWLMAIANLLQRVRMALRDGGFEQDIFPNSSDVKVFEAPCIRQRGVRDAADDALGILPA